MEAELASRIESHLESIAESLKVIAGRTPTPMERRLEHVFSAILVNTAQEPNPNHALELTQELDGLMQDVSNSQ